MNNFLHLSRKWARPLLSLVYPEQCYGCKNDLAVKGELLCLECKIKVGQTNHFDTKNNDLMMRLSGRVNVTHAAALYTFVKDGIVQELIHELKYRGQFRIAESLGILAGNKITSSTVFDAIDYIIPIPIHRRREIKRGFNQSEVFGRAVAKTINAEVDTITLVKKSAKKSQTKKGRDDRFQNVLDSFVLIGEDRLSGKSILLVDDVLTTGATI